MDGAQPNIVPVDAPPTLPPGRTTIHDRAGGHAQECDRELWQLGIRDGDSYDLWGDSHSLRHGISLRTASNRIPTKSAAGPIIRGNGSEAIP